MRAAYLFRGFLTYVGYMLELLRKERKRSADDYRSFYVIDEGEYYDKVDKEVVKSYGLAFGKIYRNVFLVYSHDIIREDREDKNFIWRFMCGGKINFINLYLEENNYTRWYIKYVKMYEGKVRMVKREHYTRDYLILLR